MSMANDAPARHPGSRAGRARRDDGRAPGWMKAVWGATVGLALLLFFALRALPGDTELPYSEFRQLLAAGNVARLTVAEQSIAGTLELAGIERVLPAGRAAALRHGQKGERSFTTRRVDDPDLVADLQDAGVTYSAAAGDGWGSLLLAWALPVLLLGLLWRSASERVGAGLAGALEIGKSRARVFARHDTDVTFADIAGIDEARDELATIVEFLKHPERCRRLGGRMPKGVLIVGAPGTGKTLLARAVAGEAGVPFFSISGAEFVEMFVGVGAARVRDLFSQAEQKAPCIVFIDELDALGKARGPLAYAGHDEREQTLNQLLVEMDGFSPAAAVIIMAATNRPEVLDPALLRPGRFDRHIALDRPDVKGRAQILAVHARRVVLDSGVDLDALAARTAGFAGADLANLVNEAALLAARRETPAVTMVDFDAALDRIVAGIEKKSRVMSPREKETVAWHEAGHALVAELRPGADPVAKVSIIPRGIGTLGHTQQLAGEERWLLRRSELLDRLDVLLGGRVAEELAFGDVSTGAQNDLQRATLLARDMVTRYGMSERIGLVACDRTPGAWPARPEGGFSQDTGCSERSAWRIDDEVRTLLDEAHGRVRATLTARRGTLDALARRLLETEVVERAALGSMLGKDGVHDASTRQDMPPGARQEG